MNACKQKLLALGFLCLQSCSDDAVNSSADDQFLNPPQFEDIIWSLVEFTSIEGTQSTLIDDTAYEFRAVSLSGDLQGLADCNASRGGSYQLNDGSIELIYGAFEEAVCEGQSEQSWISQNGAIEDLLFNPQNNPRIITFEDDMLFLSLADGRFMIFNRVERFSNL